MTDFSDIPTHATIQEPSIDPGPAPPPEDPDRVLWSAWRDGDKKAGNTLVTRYFTKVRRFFLSKDEGEYKDLTNTTFEQCTKSKHLFRQEATFAAFLFGIAYHVLCRHLRKKRRADLVGFDPELHTVIDAGLPGMSSIYAADQRARMLFECMRKLRASAQVILELRYWSGLSEPEIQATLELDSRGAVVGRLRSARQALLDEWAKLPNGLRLGEPDFAHWMTEIRRMLDGKRPKPR